MPNWLWYYAKFPKAFLNKKCFVVDKLYLNRIERPQTSECKGAVELQHFHVKIWKTLHFCDDRSINKHGLFFLALCTFYVVMSTFLSSKMLKENTLKEGEKAH